MHKNSLGSLKQAKSIATEVRATESELGDYSRTIVLSGAANAMHIPQSIPPSTLPNSSLDF